MNIYLYELKSLRRFTAIWTAAMMALAALYLSIFPSMVRDVDAYRQLLEQYPPAVRAMLGVDLGSLASVLGYYAMVFAFVALCGTIEAMVLGASILSKEPRQRVSDFLLVKPVSRARIVTAKLLAGLTALLATDILYFAFAALMANAVKTTSYSMGRFLLINFTMLFLQLIFFALGAGLSVFFRRLRNVLPLSLGVTLGFYVLGALINGGKEDDTARFFSPFCYFLTSRVLKDGRYEAPYLVTSAVIVAVCVAAAYIMYVRKDIHAV